MLWWHPCLHLCYIRMPMLRCHWSDCDCRSQGCLLQCHWQIVSVYTEAEQAAAHQRHHYCTSVQEQPCAALKPAPRSSADILSSKDKPVRLETTVCLKLSSMDAPTRLPVRGWHLHPNPFQFLNLKISIQFWIEILNQNFSMVMAPSFSASLWAFPPASPADVLLKFKNS